MLKLNNIEVKYQNSILVLRGVTMEVREQSAVALLGSNGAGKTTTLKAISGLLKTEVGEITDGSIELDGRRIDGYDPERIVSLGVSQAMEGRRIFKHLTVEENLRAGKKGGGVTADLEMVYTYFPRLQNLRRRTAGFLSGGEQQMMIIGAGLMAHPRYLLLDEPSLGLSPQLTDEIFRIINRILKNEKTAILLVEQNAMIALEVAEYGYIMENGRVVLDGPADKLKDNEDIKEFYLGLSEFGTKKSYKDVKHYRRRKRWLG
jgi:branched-chain amino acid transport system ATP-binding protein